MKIKYFLPVFCLSALVGCELDEGTIDAPPVSQATKDLFVRYVSIGNSLTSGYTNGGLRTDFQLNSFPAQIARQAGLVVADNGTTTSADEFEIPYVGMPGLYKAGFGTLELNGFDTSGNPVIAPGGTWTTLPLNNSALAKPYNNLGVPGATAFQVMLATSSAGFGAGNTYFDIVLRGQGTVIQQAMVQQPTFASVWLGNNEVLGYATAGGLFDLDPNTEGFSPFNKDAFALYYSAIWDSLKKVGTTKGITFTVPKVTNAPFFTTLKPYFTHEDNPAIPENVKVPVWGQELDGTSRKLKETEFVLLTASDSLKVGYGQDSLKALQNQFILDEAEIAVITDFTNSYNSTINSVAQTNGIPVVEINAFLEKFLPENGGYELNGITLTTEFISGGLFGLDGVHPNVVGYGLLTNEIIPKINEKYGTNLPLVNVNELIGTAK